MGHPLFEIVKTTTGVISIRNKIVNEIMHNPVGPWIEANSLYIDQSQLRERLSETSLDELILFDVGLGAAANALAAIACAQAIHHTNTGGSRPLRLISFERDLELLKFALENAAQFAHFTGQESILSQILRHGQWSKGRIFWELRQGDFLEMIQSEQERPHLVFFDPYSPNVNNDMWTTACFEKIYAKSRKASQGGTSLYTYSQATRIRAALLKAGFFVGYGVSTGLKKETTVASTVRADLKLPVGVEWFERWKRSDVRYPYDCGPEDQKAFDQFMENSFS